MPHRSVEYCTNNPPECGTTPSCDQRTDGGCSLTVTEADLIWNRAAMENGGSNPLTGDLALASLLHAHSLTMNGGVLHAVECLESAELFAALSGYRYFDLAPVADLLSRARAAFDANDDLESQEPRLDLEYATLIPDDQFLFSHFQQRLASHPDDFAPLS